MKELIARIIVRYLENLRKLKRIPPARPRDLNDSYYQPDIPSSRAYSCPVCGSCDPHGYLRCNRPDCTDGRDPR